MSVAFNESETACEKEIVKSVEEVLDRDDKRGN